MTDFHDDEGRRLYKARGPDGEVAWVDHDELWRLQQSQTAQVRGDRARRRRQMILVLAALVVVALALVIYRSWSGSAGAMNGTVVDAGSADGDNRLAAEVGSPAAVSASSAADSSETAAADASGAPAATTVAAPEPMAAGPQSTASGLEADTTAPGADPQPSTSPVGGVADAVASWAAAWTRQDVAGYLAGYAEEFQPPGALSRSDWESLRRGRLLSPSSIRVEIEELEIRLGEPGLAEARFVQSYSSPDYADVVRKTLELVEREQQWLIVSERADPLQAR